MCFGVYLIIKLLSRLLAFTFCIRGTHIHRLPGFWILFPCLSPCLPLSRGTSIPRLFSFRNLFIMIQLAFSRPTAWLPRLRATRNPRLFWFQSLFNDPTAFICPSACLPLLHKRNLHTQAVRVLEFIHLSVSLPSPFAWNCHDMTVFILLKNFFITSFFFTLHFQPLSAF